MAMRKNWTWLMSTLGGLALTMPVAALASGFDIIEQSGSGLGNAYAGGAAAAEDVSTIYYNAAGLTRIKGTEAAAAIHLIRPTVRFSNQGSVAAPGRPLGGNGGDAGGANFVPNFYWGTAVNERVHVGLGINAPFGLRTEYDPTWMGRFQAIKSDLKTININPTIAYQASDKLSLGFGLNAQYIEAELTNAVDLVVAEGMAKVKGNSWGYGYNLGILYDLTPDTRIGASYRSRIDQHLTGDATFTGGVPAANGGVKADITLPDNLTVGFFHRIDPKWSVMGELAWTGWSSFDELKIVRDSGAVLSTTPEHWKDIYRVAVGANYQANEKWLLRAGLAFDQSPIPEQYLTARIPDGDRTWISFGAQYKLSSKDKLDVGYAHLFVKNSHINSNLQSSNAGWLRGNYNDTAADILSVQYTRSF